VRTDKGDTVSERPQGRPDPGDEGEARVDPSATDAAPEAPAGDPMGHRFAADEEAADGAAGADEARTSGMA
jgi:hypothetical protein